MGGGRSGGGNPIFGIRNRTFFNRPTVIEALEWKYRRVMAKLGGYVRTTMQRSMRHRERPSKPYKEAPTAWRHGTGGEGALRALTEFGYDANDHTLVVGPQLITSPTLPLGGKTVPQLLNEGGEAFVTRFGNRTLARYEPRPFVKPAVDKGINKFRELLATVPLIQTKGR